MSHFKGCAFKLVLPLVVALCVLSGALPAAAADCTRPANMPSSIPLSCPPTANAAVQLNTYGVLPVMMLDLTQSPVYFSVSTNQPSTYANGKFPIAAGMSGVYFPQSGGVTANFANVTTPGPTSTPSLNPVATPATSAGSSGYTYATDYSYVNAFTLFPSWTGTTSFPYTQYLSASTMNNTGAAVTGATISAGFPSANPAQELGMGTTTAYFQSMAKPSVTTIKMNLLANPNAGDDFNITITSLGGVNTPPSASGKLGSACWSVLGSIFTLLSDAMVLADPDPIGIGSMIYGMIGTVNGAYSQLNDNATANSYYGAKYQGISVTASAGYVNQGGSMSLVEGDNDGLLYQVGPATLPLLNQNWVLVTTWRQTPSNTGLDQSQLSSSDLLIVAVINQGVYAANQTQQYINAGTAQGTLKKNQYKPTRAQAEDSLKILGILTAIAKTHPQDAQFIVENFGIHGNYEKMGKDQLAVKNLHIELVKILDRHKAEFPVISQYLSKLAQKSI